MSETTTEATTETAGQTSADTSTEATTAVTTTEAASEKVDWQAKFEAQQKVTRDLEKKVKGEAGSLKTQVDALQAKLDGKEAEHAAEQAKREVEVAALAKANERILKAEIRAAAAGKVAPDMLDALPGLLDLSSFEVGDDGEVDASAITDAITDLITKRPSLAAQGGRFQGSADGGARNDAGTSIDDQIAEATKAGNHQLAIALKQRRSAELAAKKS